MSYHCINKQTTCIKCKMLKKFSMVTNDCDNLNIYKWQKILKTYLKWLHLMSIELNRVWILNWISIYKTKEVKSLKCCKQKDLTLYQHCDTYVILLFD